MRIFLFLFLFLYSFQVAAQTLQWARRVGGSSSDQGTRSAVDVNGNIYVVGSFQGSNVDFDPGPGTFLMSSGGLKDGFVAKYNQWGDFQWAFRIGGANQDDVEDVSVDKAGNLVIAGYFRGSNVDFNPSTAVNSLNSNGEGGGDPGYGGDVFVAKYDTLGNYQWAFNVGGSMLGDNATGVDTDNDNNILITGYFMTTVDFDPSSSTANLNSSNGVIFVAKYSPTGQYLWAFNTGQGFSDNAGFRVLADHQNNVLVTGFFQGGGIDFDPSSGTAALSSAGGFDFFVAKYSPGGQYLWARRAGGPGTDVGRSLTVDAANNVYVTGDYNSGSINFNNNLPANNLVNKGGNDLFLVKYSSTGDHIWSFATGGPASEFGLGIDADAQDNIVITGAFNGTNVDFDPSPNTIGLSAQGSNDIYAVKYSSSGHYLCSFRVGGPNNDNGRSVFNFGSTIYVSGFFNGAAIDFDPGPGTTALTSAGEDVFFAKYDWTIIPPEGTFTGTSNCVTGQVFFTFTATAGTGPFSLHINNGSTTVVYNNIQSGVSFQLTSSPSASNTYTLVGIKDANQCSALTPVAVSVTVDPVSLPISTSGNTSICRLDSVQLTASGGSTYHWSPAAGLSDPAIPNPKASPAATTTYKVVVTNASGCKDSALLTVAIKPSPLISVLPLNTTVCTGDSVQLTASGGTDYRWTPASGLSDPLIASPKASPLVTTTYQLVVTNAEGCKDSVTKTVTRAHGPLISINADGAICKGDSLQLNASGGISYQWVPSAGLDDPSAASPKASPAATTTYKVIVANAEGCKDSAATTVQLKPSPTLNLAAVTPVCKGDTVQLRASGGSQYSWSPSASLTNSTVANPRAFPAVTTTYTVTGSAPNGCIDSAKLTVTVNQPPAVSISPDGSVCAGDSIQLTAGGGTGYHWSPATGMNDVSLPTPKASPTATTTYKVIVASAANCVDSAFVTITVNPKPVLAMTPSFALCEGDTAQLVATGGVSYQWFPQSGLTGSSTAAPLAHPSSTTTYKVVAGTAQGCIDSMETVVSVNAKPKPDLGRDTVICLLENLTLDAAINNATGYQWNNGATTPSITVNQPGIYTVRVAVSGCNNPSTDTIVVNDLPDPVVSLGDDTAICFADTLRIEAKGSYIDAYHWNTGSRDSIIYVSRGGTYTITASNKCNDTSASIVITVQTCSEDLFFPTGFTPNRDGRNDVFRAGNLHGLPVFDYNLKVFNRWGEKVFETNNPNHGWDGRINGSEQPTGVFVWLATYRKNPHGAAIVKKGTTVLIR